MTVAEEVQAERELSKEFEKYPGQWVAVRGHEVVASAETLGELLEQVESTSEEVEVLRIPAEKAAACFPCGDTHDRAEGGCVAVGR